MWQFAAYFNILEFGGKGAILLRSPLPVNFDVELPTSDSTLGNIYQHIFSKPNVMICMCVAHELSRVPHVYIDWSFKQLIDKRL